MMKLLFILCCLLPYAFAADLIAIDVALTPEKKLDQDVRALNADAFRENPKSFLFDQSHFPHLTLIQGLVSTADLPAVEKIVKKYGDKKIALTPEGVEKKDLKGSPGDKLYNLNFGKTSALTKLQTDLVKELRPYLKTVPEKEAFFEPKKVQNEFVDYAVNYVATKTGSEFSPHMTLGVVHSAVKLKEPSGKKYDFDKLELFQVGEYGSARKKIE